MTNEQRIEPMVNYFGVSIEDVKGPSRSQGISVPRFYCMIILRLTTQMTLREIGKFFGGRHYSTVIHATEEFLDFESDSAHYEHQRKFESIVSDLKANLSPFSDLVGYDQMYLNLIVLEP